MKTIEERALNYANTNPHGNPYNWNAHYDAYKDGATDQKAIDTTKVVEWLKNNLGYYDQRAVYIGTTYEDKVINDFVKYMEEKIMEDTLCNKCSRANTRYCGMCKHNDEAYYEQAVFDYYKAMEE